MNERTWLFLNYMANRYNTTIEELAEDAVKNYYYDDIKELEDKNESICLFKKD